MPFARILRLVAIVCAGFPLLAGCVYSPLDLADRLAPEFPLAGGAYVDEDGAELTFEQLDASYRVTDPDDEVYEIAFFRIPESAGYAVRLAPHQVGGGATIEADVFAYGFARQAGGAMEFRLVDMEAPLPPEVEALVGRDPGDDSGFEVRDPEDTLRVLQLVARDAALKPLMTLTPKP